MHAQPGSCQTKDPRSFRVSQIDVSPLCTTASLQAQKVLKTAKKTLNRATAKASSSRSLARKVQQDLAAAQRRAAQKRRQVTGLKIWARTAAKVSHRAQANVRKVHHKCHVAQRTAARRVQKAAHYRPAMILCKWRALMIGVFPWLKCWGGLFKGPCGASLPA